MLVPPLGPASPAGSTAFAEIFVVSVFRRARTGAAFGALVEPRHRSCAFSSRTFSFSVWAFSVSFFAAAACSCSGVGQAASLQPPLLPQTSLRPLTVNAHDSLPPVWLRSFLERADQGRNQALAGSLNTRSTSVDPALRSPSGCRRTVCRLACSSREARSCPWLDPCRRHQALLEAVGAPACISPGAHLDARLILASLLLSRPLLIRHIGLPRNSAPASQSARLCRCPRRQPSCRSRIRLPRQAKRCGRRKIFSVMRIGTAISAR